MLEELEVDLHKGNFEKPKQVLRSLPTSMLSDVQAIYEETKLRTESLAKEIFQRTTEVDEQIAVAIVERRQEVARARELQERDVQAGFDRMRRALDDRESYLLSVVKDQEVA